MIIKKPEYRMKTIVRMLERCVDPDQPCNGCPYCEDKDCLPRIMADGLYYLQQALEKSEKKTS